MNLMLIPFRNQIQEIWKEVRPLLREIYRRSVNLILPMLELQIKLTGTRYLADNVCSNSSDLPLLVCNQG